MGELKKTFGAGLAVLIILLLAPYYLELIGYSQGVEGSQTTETDVAEERDSVLAQEKLLDTPSQIRGQEQIKKTNKGLSGSEQFYIINTPLYTAKLSNFSGGSFNHYRLKEYFGAWEDKEEYKPLGLIGPTANNLYVDSLGVTLLSNIRDKCTPCIGSGYIDNIDNSEVVEGFFDCYLPHFPNQQEVFLDVGESAELVCVGRFEDKEFVKTTVFNGSSFVVNHNIIQSGGPDDPLGLVWGSGINNTEKNLYDDVSYSGVSVSYNQEIETLSFIPSAIGDNSFEGGSYSGTIDWVAMRNKYFILAMVPEGLIGKTGLSGKARQFTDNEVVPEYGITLVSSGPSEELRIKSYLGPLEIDNINQLETTLDRIMNFGWFIIQPFSRGILWLLKFFHSFGINYGIVLILFAFLVRFITGPLTKKSFESTQKMQAIQPQLKKLQEKYKNDSQKLNTEMVKMYRENGVNPLGGCFPMLLQMPLLFALFMVFRSTIEFRGAPFFWWIKDLSLPDTIFNLPFWIPVYGDQVAFLPILLGISMFLTQKMSMANMEGGMAQQKYMMYFMSAFFFLIFNSFPSGLNLYYLVYNVLNYLQQKSLKKV